MERHRYSELSHIKTGVESSMQDEEVPKFIDDPPLRGCKGQGGCSRSGVDTLMSRPY